MGKLSLRIQPIFLESQLESLHLSLRRKVLDELAEAITGSGCQTLRQLHAVRDKGIDTIFLWENP